MAVIRMSKAFVRHGTLLNRAFTLSTSRTAKTRRKVIDETTIAGAQHKASLAGPSLGYLIAELSATRRGVVRIEGQTMPEDHRTTARRVVQLIVGLPVALGSSIVGYNWMKK